MPELLAFMERIHFCLDHNKDHTYRESYFMVNVGAIPVQVYGLLSLGIHTVTAFNVGTCREDL